MEALPPAWACTHPPLVKCTRVSMPLENAMGEPYAASTILCTAQPWSGRNARTLSRRMTEQLLKLPKHSFSNLLCI